MRENYYILLELDPSIRDEAGINKAITAKQQQWSAERNHPTKGTIAQQCINKLSDIKMVLLNPETRDTEADNAKKILLAKEGEKYEKLKTQATILTKNGEIKENDLKTLAKKHKFSEDEIVKILKVKVIKEDVPYKDDGIPLLDESVIKKIRSDLEVTGKKDLFDFLSLSPTSSCSVLLKKADEIYNQSSKNANKTAEVTATNSLASTCQTYLKDEDGKKKYQKSLQYESFGEVKEMIDLAAGDGHIDADEYRKLIKACTEKGIILDRAAFFIFDYCSKKKYPKPQQPDKPDDKKQLQCGVCGHLNDSAGNNCVNCGTPLKLFCPKCSNQADSGNKVCSKCGFSICDMPNAIPLIRDVKIELKRGNFELADKFLKEAELYWPNHPDMSAIKRDISAILDKEKNIVPEIERLMNERKYVAAQRKVNELKAINRSYSNIPFYEKQITEHLTLAEQYCRKAKAEPDGDKKLDLFLSALEECADFTEAVSGSSSIPVEAPKDLVVTKSKKTVILQWTPPVNRKALKYRVIRKENVKPSGSADGEILIETSDLSYEDFSAIPGKSYYYAVYSVRGNSFSQTAELAGPVLLLENISNVKYVSGDSTVSVQWDVSAFAKKVDVFRTETIGITKHGSGQKLNSPDKKRITDSNLMNDKEYCYSMFVVYEDCTGREHLSEGVSVCATPSSPPLPVKDLKYTVQNKRVLLQWSKPNKGNVQILRSTKQLPLSEGSVLSINEIPSFGSLIPNNSAIAAELSIDFQGQIILTPLTIHNQSAVIGIPVSVTSVEEVTNVKGRILSGRLYLEWDWPVGCEHVQIRYSHDDFPNSGKINNPTIKDVSKNEYNFRSAYSEPAVNRDYYITIYTRTEVNGEVFFSNGINELVVNSEIINVHYKVVVQKLFKKSAFIEIRCNHNITVPEMTVVLKKGSVALNKNDGSYVATIPGQIITDLMRFSLPFDLVERGKFIRLFFSNEESNKKFRLQMPARDDLELK